MLCLSYYCLYSLSNKIRDKGRTVSAWKWGGKGEEGGGRGEREGVGGSGEKWPKHCMHIWINNSNKKLLAFLLAGITGSVPIFTFKIAVCWRGQLFLHTLQTPLDADAGSFALTSSFLFLPCEAQSLFCPNLREQKQQKFKKHPLTLVG
jgi:hypothetical protein